ncbi:MAG: hypothetical protein HY673_21360, partial [Chloroflexi bacterium]|nr:hypothetical protein [Chloroflexota bacterium]
MKTLCRTMVFLVALFISPSLLASPALADGDLIVTTNTTLAAGSYAFNNVTVSNNAVLTLSSDTSLPGFKGVTINAATLTIDAGSSVSADWQGYPASQGPGGTSTSAGGGGTYGGTGGLSDKATYGSALQPVDLGSGGASTAGGGAIRLITGSLSVNGSITANGSAVYYGAGAGGSIWVTTQTLSGAGTIRANGGVPNHHGGGGGGRVAVYYSGSSYTGTAEAKGGAGTISYPGQDGTVAFFDIPNNYLYTGHAFRFQANDGTFSFSKVVLSNSTVTTEGTISLTAGEFRMENNSSLTTTGNLNLTADQLTMQTSSRLTLNASSSVTVSQPLSLNGATITFNGAQSLTAPPLVLNASTLALSGLETLNIGGDITLTNSSKITHIPQGKINLNLQNLTIDATSSVS